MTEFKILTHCRASQIKVTVFHSNVITAIRIVFYCKRRSDTLTQHIQFRNENLDVSSGHLGVFALALTDSSLHLNTVLTS